MKIGFSAKKSYNSGNVGVRLKIEGKQNVYTIW